MNKIIYVRLLGEGTNVFRPVHSEQVENNIFIVGRTESYDPEDETWEFVPGSKVLVEEHKLEDEKQLVAVSLIQ